MATSGLFGIYSTSKFADAPFIFIHGEFRGQVAEHFDMILFCFPAAESTCAEPGKDLPFFQSAATQTSEG